jgi:hypothetical protein
LVEPIVSSQVAIGACLNCRQLFLITPDGETCYLCGRLPAYCLAFPPASQPEPVVPGTYPEELPPAAPPTLIGITCPHCHSNVQLSISDSEISVVPPPLPVADEEPAESAAAPDQPVESDKLVAPLAGATYPASEAGYAPPPVAEDRTNVPSP